MVLDFKDANFQSKVAQPQSYDEHTMFTEGNITSYLAELEEYIAQLITYTAHKMGDPNPSTSMVPFAKLNNKDWLARDMGIDAAYDISVLTAANEEGIEGQEEDTVNVKTLYDRFQDKVNKGLIQPVRKADARPKDQRDD